MKGIIIIGGHNISNLRYTGDTILIAESERNLWTRLLLKWAKKKRKKEWDRNSGDNEKCKHATVQHSFRWEDTDITFSYLETTVTAGGKCINEIKSWTGMAKATFYGLKKILANKKISLEVRKLSAI